MPKPMREINMVKEVVVKASTIEDAEEKAAGELGVSRECCRFEVLEAPRKTLFGKMKEALVKATLTEDAVASFSEEQAEAKDEIETAGCEKNKLTVVREYLTAIIREMGLNDVQIKITENEEGAVITFDGDGMAVLIGHHGETLDALQYLVALTCNRIDGEYYRITLDCGNYREKREETLRALAARIAAKVKKTGKSQLLEPMNPYERRIIHSVISDIDGVLSKSKGEEPNRRVVIMSENPSKASFNKGTNKREDYQKRTSYPPKKRERTMEEILKSDFREKEQKAELYSKIEL